MIYGLWLSAAGLQANKYRQDIIANNLANVETAGFKRDLAVLSERRVASSEPFGDATRSERMLDGMTGGTFVTPTYTSFEQGTIVPTERSFDLALQGDGFFSIRDGTQTAYTRDGRFTIDGQGDLVTVVGMRPVLNENGQPIRIPPEGRDDVRFGEDGSVRVGANLVAKLGVVDFADTSQLRKVGSNLLVPSASAQTKAASANVMQGAVESSTVDPTTTMVAMIEASRAYQFNATMVSMQDSMLGRAANDIAKLA